VFDEKCAEEDYFIVFHPRLKLILSVLCAIDEFYLSSLFVNISRKYIYCERKNSTSSAPFQILFEFPAIDG